LGADDVEFRRTKAHRPWQFGHGGSLAVLHAWRDFRHDHVARAEPGVPLLHLTKGASLWPTYTATFRLYRAHRNEVDELCLIGDVAAQCWVDLGDLRHRHRFPARWQYRASWRFDHAASRSLSSTS